ncbi:hypothetical protein KM176_01560 [Pseudooceanicola sp. CBS1P-1]|uniref:NADH dehydrogenase n=1 Tax=Pseudooceanicola albus TaxID=2692189 RepID=A0A6L7FYC6_9RHOB|nr:MULTISPECIES: hypothetical protein [Pseudooceanicola]MBT9382533.1 hypothetical protein [Pseudooceanicola endophyticus]MXN17074.1 hypothetical protein [Pseudooceanicola albus]
MAAPRARLIAALVLTGAGALSACTMRPQDVSEAQGLAFDQAVASVGCELRTERDYLPVELQTGLSRDQAIAMARYRMAAKQAVGLEGGGVRLTTGACAPKS